MRSVGDRVKTPDGIGAVRAIETHPQLLVPLVRYGVQHDEFPSHRPRIFKDDVLYYTEDEIFDIEDKAEENT